MLCDYKYENSKTVINSLIIILKSYIKHTSEWDQGPNSYTKKFTQLYQKYP